MSTNPERLMSPLQIQRELRLDRRHVYDGIHAGELPAYRMGEGRTATYRVRNCDFVNWLETRRVAPSVEPA